LSDFELDELARAGRSPALAELIDFTDLFATGIFDSPREDWRDTQEMIFEVKRGVYPMRWLPIFEQKKKPTLASRLLGLS
jgi:hypothetical protein